MGLKLSRRNASTTPGRENTAVVQSGTLTISNLGNYLAKTNILNTTLRLSSTVVLCTCRDAPCRPMATPSGPEPIDELRDIIRAIFYGHYNNSFQLMAVHGVDNPDDPVFFIRIHPPVRFSPHGCPLLVSVIDYPRLEELIEQGKVDREAFLSDFHRLVTERVSKEVCIIRASTNEELNLLRYVFRVNSTKMRRSVWQSRNLPRGEDTPWICTFITPLYSEHVSNTCGVLTDQMMERYIFPFCSTTCPPSHNLYRKSCAYCYVVKVQLKSCSRCNSIFYCSTLCQRSHWSVVHRKECAILLASSSSSPP